MSSAKPSYQLKENIIAFINHYGIEQCGFLTLTFPDSVHCVFEASRRFNSLRTGYLSKVMNAYIGVYERHKSGVIHFHFVLALKDNIAWEVRKGQIVHFDHEQVKNGNYSSAAKSLRRIWKQFREVLPRYGFGRHQLLPVKSEKGIGSYLAKYLVKGIADRKDKDKGFRLVRSTSGKKAILWKRVTCNFAWNGDSSKEWRKALCSYITQRANIARYRLKQCENRYYEKFQRELSLLSQMNAENYGSIMKSLYGSNWCYAEKDKIFEQWLKDKEHKQRILYFWEMGVSSYITVRYDPETGEVIQIA